MNLDLFDKQILIKFLELEIKRDRLVYRRFVNYIEDCSYKCKNCYTPLEKSTSVYCCTMCRDENLGF